MSDTTVTFENAALSEAVKRADRISPKRGEAHDKASGIVLEITPGEAWPVLLKTTNLNVYYSEYVSALTSVGEPVKWRVASDVFSQVITKLPIGSGKNVTLTEKDNKLLIQSGRFKASIGLIDKSAFYPEWSLFDPASTAPVNDLGSRLTQVAWASSKGGGLEATDGVRFNGTTLVATDKYRLACVPLEAPHITEEISIQASLLGALIPESGTVRVGIVNDKLLILPNDYIQIVCIAFAATFPNVERVMRRDHPNSIKLERSTVMEAIGRVSVADAKNRMPELNIFIGLEEVAFFMEQTGGGDIMIDNIDLPGQATHPRFKISVTPAAIIDALTGSPSDVVTMHYDPSDKLRLLYFTGGSNYESWIVPRTGTRSGHE